MQDKQVDKDLASWVKDARKDGVAVSGQMLRVQAKCKHGKAEGHCCRASNGWLQSFKRCHTLSTRTGTSIGQKLPKDHEEKITCFHRFVICLREEHDYDLDDIYNMDETPLRFDMPTGRTLDVTGTSTIHIETTTSDKRGFTVVLCVSATGLKGKPLVIFNMFKGVRDPKIKNSCVYARVQKKGYIDEGLCLEWNQWIRIAFPINGRCRLLVWDSCSVHLTDKVKAELKRRKVDIAVFPGGLTSLLQPLDVAVNRPFKHHARQQWNDWMISGDKN